MILQRFPLTFKLAGPAANLGVRHGSVVVGAHWGLSNTIQAAARLVGETTVKGVWRDIAGEYARHRTSERG